ncbi:GntR family transcriptional regulator [Microbacterium sp. Marseille-Q6965]|uniref:GntR family transcriptional regulator n=1 Tax=Microbacterium sp. Marseille-Q6965 TaxID=2965072 RepID=UPI0021B754A0|nr:GntR family transcriptional regulator [Microbacterium sp. Marseille-Q6965]
MPVDSVAPIALSSAPRLSDMVFDRLAEAIVRGEFAPGEALRDQQLADRLGVSRMPVREAIQRLERAGLVEMAASRYTRVARITPERVRDTVEHAGYLYGAVTRMAVQRMTDTELATALRLLDESGAVIDDLEAYLEAGTAVNDHLVACCGNNVLSLRTDVFHTLRWVLRQALAPADHQLDLRRLHGELTDAVAARDADRAEDVIRELYGVGRAPRP